MTDTHSVNRHKNSPFNNLKNVVNYRNGRFQNQEPTSVYTEGMDYLKLLKVLLFKGSKPTEQIPVIKRDLKLPATSGIEITWFGHSSYMIRINDQCILVDPVLNDTISPLKWLGGKGFPGTYNYTIDDLPDIHAIIISHDHYDHLNYNTIKKLSHKTCHFFVPLGVGAYLRRWGIDRHSITEMDWWEESTINNTLRLTATPARHFSGRTFTTNKTLWASYVLRTGTASIYIGGDSGYGQHFKEIGNRFGPFDIVILECGQYGAHWPDIHMQPAETIQAALDLKGKWLLPVHWGKFTLAFHDWNEPVRQLLILAHRFNINTITPRIGEKVVPGETTTFPEWWE